jgi:hypothetical protein
LERTSFLRKAGACLALLILGSVGSAQSLPQSAPKHCSVGQTYNSGSYTWNCSSIDVWTVVNFNTIGTGGSGGTGTVTHTSTALTPGQIAVGNGNADLKVGNLSGDVTTAGGTATTLATVNSAPGSCGDATHVCQVTTNGKGLVTAQSAVSITGAGGGGTGISSGTLAAIPSTCTVGGSYIATDQPVSQQLYFCTVTNTWSQFLPVGSSGALQISGGAIDVVPSVVPKLNAANAFSGSNTFAGTTTLNNVVINGTCSGVGCATGGGGGTTVAATGPYLTVAGVNYIPSHMSVAIPFVPGPFNTSVGSPIYTQTGAGNVATFSATSGQLNSSTRPIATNGIFHMAATCNLGADAGCGIVAEEGTASNGIQLFCQVIQNGSSINTSSSIACYRFVNGVYNSFNFRLNPGLISAGDIWLGFEYNSTTQATTLVTSGDGGRNWVPLWTIAKFNIFNTAPTKFGVGVGVNGTGLPTMQVLSLDVQ